MGLERIRSMDWREWSAVSIPCGLVTSGDIGLSNLSVVTLSLTFYTMVKASTPVFVLGWAYLFGIEKITLPLIGVVFLIATGELLTVSGEVQFELKGFVLCLTASMLSGARWTLVQLKLQTMEPPLKTTIATMRLLAPSMFFSLLIISMIIEKPWDRLSGYSVLYNVEAFALGMLGAFFAISMILCEFYLIMHASAIILMIGGVIKEMITIVLGVTIFKDELNRINMLGCFVVLLGVVAYKIIFHLEKQKRKNELHRYGSDRGSPITTDPAYDPVVDDCEDPEVVPPPKSSGLSSGIELRKSVTEDTQPLRSEDGSSSEDLEGSRRIV